MGLLHSSSPRAGGRGSVWPGRSPPPALCSAVPALPHLVSTRPPSPADHTAVLGKNPLLKRGTSGETDTEPPAGPSAWDLESQQSAAQQPQDIHVLTPVDAPPHVAKGTLQGSGEGAVALDTGWVLM